MGGRDSALARGSSAWRNPPFWRLVSALRIASIPCLTRCRHPLRLPKTGISEYKYECSEKARTRVAQESVAQTPVWVPRFVFERHPRLTSGSKRVVGAEAERRLLVHPSFGGR